MTYIDYDSQMETYTIYESDEMDFETMDFYNGIILKDGFNEFFSSFLCVDGDVMEVKITKICKED